MIDSLCGSLPSLTLYLLLSTFPLHVAAVAVTRCFDSPINGPNQALLVYSPQDPSTSTGGSVVLTTEVVYSTVYADDPLSSSPSTYMTSPQPSVSSSAIINRPVASTSPSTTSAPSASAQPTLAPNPTQNSTMSKNSTSGYRSVAYFTNWVRTLCSILRSVAVSSCGAIHQLSKSLTPCV